jgi:hypothetical protein
MPYGAGSAFVQAYAYGWNRPTVMVDPSGLRGVSVSTRNLEGRPGRPGTVPAPRPSPVASPGPRSVLRFLIFVTGAAADPDERLDSSDWPAEAKNEPEKATKKLNGRRVLFRSENNTGKNFTPRPGKDTDGYPSNGLSTYTFPHQCRMKCILLDLDRLQALVSIVQMARDPKDPTHVFLRAVEKNFHVDWSNSRDSEEEAILDARTRAVRSTVIDFWGVQRLAG